MLSQALSGPHIERQVCLAGLLPVTGLAFNPSCSEKAAVTPVCSSFVRSLSFALPRPRAVLLVDADSVGIELIQDAIESLKADKDVFAKQLRTLVFAQPFTGQQQEVARVLTGAHGRVGACDAGRRDQRAQRRSYTCLRS